MNGVGSVDDWVAQRVAVKASRRARPHYVYRLYDTDGRCLYIGCSYNPVQRIQQHHKKPWWPEVVRQRIVGPFQGRDAAESEESRAHFVEKPLHSLCRQQVGRMGPPAKARINAALAGNASEATA